VCVCVGAATFCRWNCKKYSIVGFVAYDMMKVVH